jgi:hypothetical protein
MISYLTEIDMKAKEVRTTFRKEVRTFGFNNTTFSIDDALKVAAEDFHNQLCDWLAALVEHAEKYGGDQ